MKLVLMATTSLGASAIGACLLEVVNPRGVDAPAPPDGLLAALSMLAPESATTPRRGPLPHYTRRSISRASSRNRQRPLAQRICSGVRQSGSKRRGEATTMHAQRARLVATFRRFGL